MRNPIDITDGVWFYPPDAELLEANVGIICTDTQTILIDAGNSARHAREIMAALSIIDAPPVRHLIYTHHHWDHTFGASIFVHPNIIAHEICGNKLEAIKDKPWGSAYLSEESYNNPQLAKHYENMNHGAEGNWRGFYVCVPNMVFSNQLTLYLDDITLELKHVGGNHARDSIVIGIPERKILFLGDCFYPPPLHEQVTASDNKLNLIMLKSLLNKQYKWYLDGHNPPQTNREIKKFITEAE